MDRAFVIAQISDLHLDGSGRLLATTEALSAAIREAMADFADVPDRILLITGDLVDDPTPRALDEVLTVIASFRVHRAVPAARLSASSSPRSSPWRPVDGRQES